MRSCCCTRKQPAIFGLHNKEVAYTTNKAAILRYTTKRPAISRLHGKVLSYVKVTQQKQSAPLRLHGKQVTYVRARRQKSNLCAGYTASKSFVLVTWQKTQAVLQSHGKQSSCVRAHTCTLWGIRVLKEIVICQLLKEIVTPLQLNKRV